MPTLRIGDRERSSINSAFEHVTKRAKNNKPFPLIETDFPEFGLSLLDPRVAGPYELLMELDKDLLASTPYAPDFTLDDGEYEYTIGVYRVAMPKSGMVLPDNHPRHAELLEWVISQCAIERKVAEATAYLYTITEACSSIGQLKRVLPAEIIRFVPDHMQSYFAEAERRSRVPAALCIDTDLLNVLADVLTLGSISPEARTGLQAFVHKTTI